MDNKNAVMPPKSQMPSGMPKAKDMQKAHDKMMNVPKGKKTHKGQTTK